MICCRKKVGKVQSSSFAKSPKGKPGPAVPLECNLEIDFTAKPLLKYYNKGLAYHIYGMFGSTYTKILTFKPHVLDSNGLDNGLLAQRGPKLL